MLTKKQVQNILVTTDYSQYNAKFPPYDAPKFMGYAPNSVLYKNYNGNRKLRRMISKTLKATHEAAEYLN
jgi:hypothetical protein